MRTAPTGHEVLANDRLAHHIHRIVLRAGRVAPVRRPGQFVIVRLAPGGERIPLTIADADPDRGTITLVVQAVGKTTADLVGLPAGASISDVVGPLGRPTDILEGGHAVCVGGGVGTAVLLPLVRALSAAGCRVTSVIGARTRELVVLEDDLAALGAVVVSTDDGSYGREGPVTSALAGVLAAGDVDAVYAAGPVPMMRAVAEATRPLGIPTVVSLNPIMVDGTGMCGGCRVTVGGAMRFACVDGPEFDGHSVDFDELADRLATYREAEQEAVARSSGRPAWPGRA